MALFDPKKVGIAVVTSYPKWYSGKIRSIKHTDKVRGDLAIEFAQKATAAGYPIVLSDGRSAKTFVRTLQSIEGLIVTKRKTTVSGQGKRLAMDRVSKVPGVEIIVLCEPEKVSFLTNCLETSVMPILEGKADIVVPKREDKLFKSAYPDYMYTSEIEANGIYNEALRANNLLPQDLYEMDSFFGPRVFRNTKELLALFKRKYHFSGYSILEKLYDPDFYSNALYFPLVNAFKKKLRVAIVEVPFSYPRLQKENEEVGQRELFIAKRNLQRVSILIDLMHFLSFLKKNRNSRVRILQ